MQFNIDFDVAAALLLVVFLILYFTKSHLPTLKNEAFQRLLFALVATDFLDILTILLMRLPSPAPAGLTYLINILLFVSQTALYYFYVLFVLAITECPAKLRRAVSAALLVPCLLFVLYVAATPLTHAIFYVDAGGKYWYGSAHLAIYLVPCVSLLLGLGLLLTQYKRGQPPLMLAVCLFHLIIVGGALLQAFLIPHILICYFTSSMALLSIYFIFLSPEYYLNHGTDIFNRLALSEAVEERLALGAPICGAAVLLDNLHTIQEAASQSEVDQLLIAVKDYLAAFPRATVFYWDSIFCVLVGKPGAAGRAAEDIRARLSGPWAVSGRTYALSAQILLLDSLENFETSGEFFSLMKYFHSQGAANRPGQVVTLEDHMIQRWRRYEAVLKLLRAAIEENGILVYYQPIYSVEAGGFQTAEALVRLNDTGNLGPVSPEEFIPIAEQENLMCELGQRIFQTICKFIRTSGLAARGIRCVQVNLSVKQCVQPDLCAQLQAVMEEYQIPPSFFSFEVTETVYADESSMVRSNMEKLRRLGCGFSLDDFGSGYANLNYLVDFSFSLVKLDKMLVWACYRDGSEKARVILENVIAMLKKLGVGIVAEGVEDLPMVDRLTALGVPYLQGYHYARPLPEPTFLQFLETHGA